MDLIDYLKDEIRKTGYPLEIEISSLLDGKWDKVVNTAPYFDKTEKKLRDIDIDAFRQIYAKNGIEYEPHLTIECKKSDNMAWVFFMRNMKWDEVFPWGQVHGQYIDGLQRVTELGLCNDILGSTKLHYYDYNRVAVCFAEFSIQGKQNENHKKEIFEAEMQLKKYLEYSNDELLAATNFPFFLQFYFPCIVFDGKLYEANVSKVDTSLKEVLSVPLVTGCYVIDIIQKSYFSEYLKVIDSDIELMNQVISGKQKEIWQKFVDVANKKSDNKT